MNMTHVVLINGIERRITSVGYVGRFNRQVTRLENGTTIAQHYAVSNTGDVLLVEHTKGVINIIDEYPLEGHKAVIY